MTKEGSAKHIYDTMIVNQLTKSEMITMPWMSVRINFGIAGVQITGRSIQKYLKKEG